MKQRFVFQIFAIIFIAIAGTGCAGLKDYQKAQNSFNQGATLEMNIRAKSVSTELPASPDLERMFPAATPPDPSSRPEAYYNGAYAQVNKALTKSSKLKSNDVLGEALTIKSLCEWKLKKYNEACETAKSAAAELDMEQETAARDKVLMAALSGLVAIDLAHDTIVKMRKLLLDTAENPDRMSPEQALALYEQSKMHFEEFVFSRQISRNSIWQGIQTLDDAKMKGESTHPIQRYLLLSQLAGLKNWTDALDAIDTAARRLGVKRTNAAAKDWIEGQKEFYRTTRDGYLAKLATLLGSKTEQAYLDWERIL